MSVAPPLTIGVRVYNGQNYLSESLDSLLAQLYGLRTDHLGQCLG
jgi:glycosyltransferase involved in cell wall biosynthesis